MFNDRSIYNAGASIRTIFIMKLPVNHGLIRLEQNPSGGNLRYAAEPWARKSAKGMKQPRLNNSYNKRYDYLGNECISGTA